MATSMRRWQAAAKRVTAEYYVPHLAQAPMEPPARPRGSRTATARSGAAVQSPQAIRTRPCQAPQHAGRQGHGQRHAAGRRLRPQVQARLRDRGGALAREPWAAPVKVVWTREDDLHHSLLSTPSRSSAWRRGSTRTASPSPGCIAASAPTLMALFVPDPKPESPIELGMGLSQRRSRSPTCASRTPRRRRTRGSAGSARCRTSRTRSPSRLRGRTGGGAGRTPRITCST